MSRPGALPVKTILLTGVARGLGRALLSEFDVMGHRVIGCSRSADAVRSLQQAFGPPHCLSAVDVADDSQVQRWARRILAEFDVPDLVLNNAALMNRPGPLWSVGAAEFRQLMAVNVDGIANVARHFLPAMVRRGDGVWVNFSSGWGRTTDGGVAPYCASKWAVEGLSQSMSQEVPPGLAVVALNPGIIDTDMLRLCWPGNAGSFEGPEAWARRVAPWLLRLDASSNGLALTAPGCAA
jgi:NAD(P)-dependent dehydrogenase (short-subunit alcohol dehydrogenase family)